MKLVGASNWYVRGPFMLEGLLQGFIGAIAAVVLLFLGKQFVLPEIVPDIDTRDDVAAWSFEVIALILIGVGLLLGAAGSGITIRRFLKI
jgi:cell division transport system permease protein